MVVYYKVLGREIGSHWLAIGVLSTLATGITLSTGGSKAKKASGPPINASSPDEEKFIQDFLKNVDGDEKKEPAKH